MKRSALALLIVSAFALAACGGQQAAAPPPSGGGAAAPTLAAAPSEAAPPTATDAPEPEPDEAVSLSDVSQGLDVLDSYRTDFTFGFVGTDNGQAVDTRFTYVTEYVRNPPAQRFATSGGPAGDQTFEIIITGGQSYTNITGQCFATAAEEDPSDQLGISPSDFVGDINSSDFVGPENVNNVNALHYRSNLPTSPLLAGLSNATVDFWVSPEGYLVKYLMQAEGSGQAIFGSSESAVGTVTMEYNLLSVNQPIDITAPENCGGAPEDVPLLTDATDVSSFGDLISYTSTTSLEDATEFYNTEMAANGWAAQPGGVGAPGFAQLTFTKDDRTASITITFDESANMSTILIQVSGG